MALCTGKAGAQDYVEAMKWHLVAAELGDADHQKGLGDMYYNGQGVRQDYTEAAKWYRMAVEQGDAGGQNNLGFIYEEGRGVPQNYLQAHVWVNLAASTSQGEENEKYAKSRKLIAENMTSAQIAEAQRLAREWKPKTWDELKEGL